MDVEEPDYDTGSEDEDGKYATDDVDVKIFDMLAAIRRNDPSLNDSDKKFFDEKIYEKDSTKDTTKSQHQRDFERQQEKQEIQKRRAELIDSFFESGKEKNKRTFKLKDLQDHQGSNRTQSEMDLQEQARREFELAVREELEDDEEEDDDIFTKKKKSAQDLQNEDEEYETFKEKMMLREKDALGLKTASLSHLDNQDITEEDKFLRDYLLNKLWQSSKSEKQNEDDEYYDEDMRRDELIDELEEKAQEENLTNNLLPDKHNTYRFQERGASHIKMYPTSFKSSIREKKPSKKERYSQRRNERFREILQQTKLDQKRKARELQRKIIRQVLELKQLIRGDGSVVDMMDLNEKSLIGIDEEPAEEDAEEGLKKTDDDEPKTQLDHIWLMVEHNTVVEELLYADIDDAEDFEEEGDDEEDEEEVEKRKEWDRTATPQEKRVRALRRQIRKDFEQFYELFFEEVGITDDKYKFKYKRVEKDDYGLSTLDVLELEDDDLEKVVPIDFVTRWDARPSNEKVKEQVQHKLKKLQYQNKQVSKYSDEPSYYDKKSNGKWGNDRRNSNYNDNYREEKPKYDRRKNNTREDKPKTFEKKKQPQKRKHEQMETHYEESAAPEPTSHVEPKKTFSFKYAEEAEREMKNKEKKKRKEEAKRQEQEKIKEQPPQKKIKVRTEEDEKKSAAAFDDGFLRVKKKPEQKPQPERSEPKQTKPEKVQQERVEPKKAEPKQEKAKKVEAAPPVPAPEEKKKTRRGTRGKKKKETEQ